MKINIPSACKPLTCIQEKKKPTQKNRRLQVIKMQLESILEDVSQFLLWVTAAAIWIEQDMVSFCVTRKIRLQS